MLEDLATKVIDEYLQPQIEDELMPTSAAPKEAAYQEPHPALSSTRELIHQVLAASQELRKTGSITDQLDSSLTNLFDSLSKPLVHENKFDLT